MNTTYTKLRPETIFQLLTFTFDPSSMSSGVILLQRPYVSFSSPLLLILRQEINAAAVALFYVSCSRKSLKNSSYIMYRINFMLRLYFKRMQIIDL